MPNKFEAPINFYGTKIEANRATAPQTARIDLDVLKPRPLTENEILVRIKSN